MAIAGIGMSRPARTPAGPTRGRRLRCRQQSPWDGEVNQTKRPFDSFDSLRATRRRLAVNS